MFDLRAVVCASARTTAVKPHSCGAREQKVRHHRGNVSGLGGFAAQERFDLRAVVRASAHTTAVKPHSCGAREQKVRRQKVSLFAWVPGKRR